MEAELKKGTEDGFAAAKVIYETGGNSKVSATMTLTGSLTKWPISSGTILYGAGTNGLIVSGSGSSSGSPSDGTFTVTVKYAGGTCQSFIDDKSKCEYMKLI